MAGKASGGWLTRRHETRTILRQSKRSYSAIRILHNTPLVIGLALIILIVPFLVMLWLYLRTAPPANTYTDPGTGETELVPLYEEQRGKFESIINNWRDAVPATSSVVVTDIVGEYSVPANETQVYVPGGLEGLYTAAALYLQAEELGDQELEADLGYGSTAGECLEEMLLTSDFICGESVGLYVGWPVIEAIVKEIGLANTQLDVFSADELPDELPDRQTQPDELAIFMNSLFEGIILNEKNTTEYLDLLAQHKQTDRIPTDLPSGVSIAHLSGGIDDAFHDVGFISVNDDRVYSYVITSAGWNTLDRKAFAPQYFRQLLNELIVVMLEF